MDQGHHHLVNISGADLSYHYQVFTRTTLLFGPIDMGKLWNPFNRIRITMGKFGCTQIQTSSSWSPEKKKDFFNMFLGFGIFCPEDKNRPQKLVDWFLTPSVTFLVKFWGYRWAHGSIFGSNIPLILLIDPWKWLMFPHTGTNIRTQKPKLIWAKTGQNPLYDVVSDLMHNAVAMC